MERRALLGIQEINAKLGNRLVAKSHFRLVAHDLPVVRRLRGNAAPPIGNDFWQLYKQQLPGAQQLAKPLSVKAEG